MKKLFLLTFTILISLTLILSPSAEGREVSYGKSYTLITPASSAYPDDGIKLTDGIFGTVPDGKNNYYSSAAYVGFNQKDVNENGDFVIILDLGRKYTDLSAFTVGFLNETDVGIYAPTSVTFAVSDERNGEYDEIGTLDTEKSKTGGLSETFAMTLAADDTSGRFVRVTVKHLGKFTDENGVEQTSGWTFIDEISVYSSDNGNENENNSQSPTDESQNVSDIQSDAESVPDATTESLPEQVKPGDGSASFIVWTLLAVSALTMTLALFFKKKKSF